MYKHMKRMSRRGFLGTGLAGASAALLAACQAKVVEVTKLVPVEKTVKETVVVEKAVTSQVTKSDVQELRVGSQFFLGNGDLASLDPARRGTWGFHHLLWAPLVAGDTAGKPYPEQSLAESWEVSADAKVYTFHLRKGAKFSDGTPITAKDVVDCFGHWGMMHNKQALGYRDNYDSGNRLYYDVVGLLGFPDKVAYDEFGTGPMEGVKALDDSTVQITLDKPAESFIKRLTVAFAVWKSKDMEAAKTAKYALKDYWPAHVATSGPYKISEAVPGDHYTMVPNPNYFGPKPQINKVIVPMVSQDRGTQFTAFANKELDILAVPLTGNEVRQALADPYLKQCLVELPNWVVYRFRIIPFMPMDDVYVRRAVAMAVDRAQMIKVLNAGSEVELFRTINMHRNPAVPHCVEETAKVVPLPFDPAKAKEELKKSKYYPQLLDTEINFYGFDKTTLSHCEIVQKMLQDNLGFKKVTIRTDQIADTTNLPYPCHFFPNTQMPWYADIVDTLRNTTFTMRDVPLEQVKSALDCPSIPNLRDLVEAALIEPDPAKKCQMIQQAGQIWEDQVLTLNYGVAVSRFLIAPWVKDTEWYQNANQGKPLNFHKAWVAKH